jgi:hypothetical protein
VAQLPSQSHWVINTARYPDILSVAEYTIPSLGDSQKRLLASSGAGVLAFPAEASHLDWHTIGADLIPPLVGREAFGLDHPLRAKYAGARQPLCPVQLIEYALLLGRGRGRSGILAQKLFSTASTAKIAAPRGAIFLPPHLAFNFAPAGRIRTNHQRVAAHFDIPSSSALDVHTPGIVVTNSQRVLVRLWEKSARAALGSAQRSASKEAHLAHSDLKRVLQWN